MTTFIYVDAAITDMVDVTVYLSLAWTALKSYIYPRFLFPGSPTYPCL